MREIDPSEYIVQSPEFPRASKWQLMLSCLYPVKIESDRYQGSGWIDRVLLQDIITYRWTKAVDRKVVTIATDRYKRNEEDELLPSPWWEDMQNWEPRSNNE